MLTVIDTRYGARLGEERFAFTPDEPERMVRDCVAHVRANQVRLTGGVKQVIGLSDFKSLDVGHRFDHLQSGFMVLLRSPLTRQPGVAVAETRLAESIAKLESVQPVTRDKQFAMYVERADFVRIRRRRPILF